MKKVIVTGIVIVAFGVYAIFGHKSQDLTPVSVTKSTTQSSGGNTETSTVGSSVYKDGEYTGSTADAFYGPLQVKATIQSGKITDVQFLQYPNDKPESTEISNSSMPILKHEAITVQNSKVDIVSGATQTSQAFQESLASALSQAK